MNTKLLITSLVLCLSSCNKTDNGFQDTQTEIAFDGTKWQIRKGDDYPFRDQMLNDLFEKDTLKGLNKTVLSGLLGEADRTDANFLFYRITQERAGDFPLHTKTLVIELANDTVKAVRIHE